MMPSQELLLKMKDSQKIARKAVAQCAADAQEGWSEKDLCAHLDQILKDLGVSSYFHYPFAWVDERTSFQNIRFYWQYKPRSDFYLKPNSIAILDVAPIYNHVSSDIGYTFSLSENSDLIKAKNFLNKLRVDILDLFKAEEDVRNIWKHVSNQIQVQGYQVTHKRYPFQVLGHRLFEHKESIWDQNQLLAFGYQAYHSLLKKGVKSELISPYFKNPKWGVWAIEPHIGTPKFGAKFEEILVVTPENTYWLDEAFI